MKLKLICGGGKFSKNVTWYIYNRQTKVVKKYLMPLRANKEINLSTNPILSRCPVKYLIISKKIALSKKPHTAFNPHLCENNVYIA